jgi:omega-hydroxy-beta-dihydromenaquinone-9 sulfotransferase
MMRLFPLPLITFFRISQTNGGISFSKLLHILPWMVKHILFEPLRIMEYLIYERKIQQYKFDSDPIFILGYYRSGTTYLQRLFIQDKNLGYQNVFQSALPEITLGFEYLLTPILSLISNLLRIKNDFHKIPFTWDFPGEEDVALTGLTFKESVNWGNLFPNAYFDFYEKFAWSESDDAAKWTNNYCYWLKKLSIRNKGKRLILKSPPNTARIGILLNLFPNAKFVCIHRDPFQVYTSNQRFWRILNQFYSLQSISEEDVNRIILKSFNRTMNGYHQLKVKIPGNNLFEITYEALANDPYHRFKVIYEQLDVGDFNQIDHQVQNFVKSTRSYPSITYEHSKEEQKMIKENWDCHIKYWEKLRSENR